MRPTYFVSKHPKEKTGEFLFPLVTYKGLSLNFRENQSSNKQVLTKFSRDKRFIDYHNLSQITGPLVGPGSYNDFDCSFKLLKKPCLVKLKKLCGVNKKNTDSYIFWQNHLAHEPFFMKSCHKINKLRYMPEEVSVDLYAGVNPKRSLSINKSVDSSPIKIPNINFPDNYISTPKIYGSKKKIVEDKQKRKGSRMVHSQFKSNFPKNALNITYKINKILGIRDINDSNPSKSSHHFIASHHNMKNRSLIMNKK